MSLDPFTSLNPAGGALLALIIDIPMNIFTNLIVLSLAISANGLCIIKSPLVSVADVSRDYISSAMSNLSAWRSNMLSNSQRLFYANIDPGTAIQTRNATRILLVGVTTCLNTAKLLLLLVVSAMSPGMCICTACLVVSRLHG